MKRCSHCDKGERAAAGERVGSAPPSYIYCQAEKAKTWQTYSRSMVIMVIILTTCQSLLSLMLLGPQELFGRNASYSFTPNRPPLIIKIESRCWYWYWYWYWQRLTWWCSKAGPKTFLPAPQLWLWREGGLGQREGQPQPICTWWAILFGYTDNDGDNR